MSCFSIRKFHKLIILVGVALYSQSGFPDSLCRILLKFATDPTFKNEEVRPNLWGRLAAPFAKFPVERAYPEILTYPRSKIKTISLENIPNSTRLLYIGPGETKYRPVGWEVPLGTDELCFCISIALVNRNLKSHTLFHFAPDTRNIPANLKIEQQTEFIRKAIQALPNSFLETAEAFIIPGRSTMAMSGSFGLAYEHLRAVVQGLQAGLGLENSKSSFIARTKFIDTSLRREKNRVVIHLGEFLVPEASLHPTFYSQIWDVRLIGQSDAYAEAKAFDRTFISQIYEHDKRRILDKVQSSNSFLSQYLTTRVQNGARLRDILDELQTKFPFLGPNQSLHSCFD